MKMKKAGKRLMPLRPVGDPLHSRIAILDDDLIYPNSVTLSSIKCIIGYFCRNGGCPLFFRLNQTPGTVPAWGLSPYRGAPRLLKGTVPKWGQSLCLNQSQKDSSVVKGKRGQTSALRQTNAVPPRLRGPPRSPREMDNISARPRPFRFRAETAEGAEGLCHSRSPRASGYLTHKGHTASIHQPVDVASCPKHASDECE